MAAERPSDGKFTSCCHKRKVKLEKPLDADHNVLHYPSFPHDLLMNPRNSDYKNIRENIRSYNSGVSSVGARVVAFSCHGPYVFKILSQIFHRTSHIAPLNGQMQQYAHIYVIDSTQATEIRAAHPANEKCIIHILDQIYRFYRQYNRLSNTYHML